MKTLYILDGLAFAYRAYYAVAKLSSYSGLPTNAVYGFTRMLKKIVDKYKPDHIAVVFDSGKPTFRHERYKEYKATRKPMPDDMAVQIAWIKKTIKAFNIPIVEKDNYEADDVMATMAVEAKRKGYGVFIFTGDKDMMQLVVPGLGIISPAKDDIVYDSEKVFEKFGVYPQNIPDLLALAGDVSDNIHGVPGIGEKKAALLVRQFGDIEKLLENTGQLTGKTKELVELHQDRIRENMELVTVKKDIPLDITPEDCAVKGPDVNALKDIYRELEFKALLKDLAADDEGPEKSGVSDKDVNWADLLDDIRKAKVVGVSAGGLYYEPCESGAAADARGERIVFEKEFFRDEKAISGINAILSDPKIKKCCYDSKSLMRQGLDLPGDFFDAYLAGLLLDNKNMEGDGTDNAKFAYRQSDYLEGELGKNGLLDLYRNIELPLIKTLAGMEKLGIKLDTDFLSGLSKEMERGLEIITRKIYAEAGEAFNINSPKQLEHVLFEKMKLPAGKRTKTGFSTDVDVLTKLAAKYELPRLMLEYRQLSKLKGTYVDALPKLVDSSDGRLHTTFHQIGAITGRISSSNPNLQNIPVKTELGKRIREAFIPGKKGWVLIGADYSQIELRILAHLCADDVLVKTFAERGDIHRQTAKEIFGDIEITEDLRRTAKTINFGIIYGMGPRSLAETLNISLKEAQEYIDKYLDRYPGVARYIESGLKEAEEKGYVVTMFGRKRAVPELKSDRPNIKAFGKRVAVNTPLQGSSADIIKMAMVNISAGISRGQCAANILLQIHDELILETPEERAKETADFIKAEMENAVKLKVPVEVNVKTGLSWADL